MGHIVGCPVSRKFGSDPSIGNVVFLCHFEGTDGATTATEEKGHALTFNSSAQIDTAQSKFGSSSLLLALTDDTVTTPDSADWHFGLAEDFTIELFVRFNNTASSSGTQTFLSHYNNVSNQRSWFFRLSGGNNLTFTFSPDGVSTIQVQGSAGSWTPSNNTWYYVVAERQGTTIRLAAGESGTPTTTVTNTSGANDDAFFDSNADLTIGALNSSGVVQELDGWIDEVRITKGVARYGGVFSVPTAPFPNS